MTVVMIQPRVRPLQALRVLLGITSKAKILAFCPRANVGVVLEHKGQDELASRDIRWVTVPHNGGLWDQMSNDGDWIVEKAPGQFFIYSDTDFHREYVML